MTGWNRFPWMKPSEGSLVQPSSEVSLLSVSPQMLLMKRALWTRWGQILGMRVVYLLRHFRVGGILYLIQLFLHFKEFNLIGQRWVGRTGTQNHLLIAICYFWLALYGSRFNPTAWD